MKKSILYYPTIDIPDREWTKRSLMYWDKVCSIVPYHDYNHSWEIRLLKEFGCYKEVYPRDIFASGGQYEFLSALDRKLQVAMLYPTKAAPTNSVHLSKFPQVSLEEIRNEYPDIYNLFRDYTGSKGWLHMDRKTALIYMQTLAEFATKNDENMTVGTSRKNEMEKLFKPGVFEERVSMPGISVILNKCLPMPQQGVTLEKVLEFKAEHESELMKLWQEIAILERAIEASSTLEEAGHEIYCFKRRIAETQHKTKELYEKKGIPYLLGSAQTVFTFVGETVIGSLFGTLDFSNQEALIATMGKLALDGAIAVGARAISRSREISEMKRSNFAYVMNTFRYNIAEDISTEDSEK